MRRRPLNGPDAFLALALLLTPAVPAAGATAAAAQSPDTARIAAVERGLIPDLRIEGRPVEGPFTIAERLAHYGVPGVSVAVVDDGRVAWAKGYGVEEAGTDRPVTAETLFQAASISKPVAALGALLLIERGELGLDDDVNRHLRSWRVPDSDAAAGQPVTLRRLLTHSAGLTVHGFGGYASSRPVPTAVEVLTGSGPANSDAVVIDLEPGTEWRYSGGGYTVMQLLLEDVTGQPFPDLMRDLVLEPLGMRLSTYRQPLPLGLRAHAATGHRSTGQPVPGRYHTYPEMAAAGLWTNPSDLARYVLAVQAARSGRPGSALPRAWVDSMLTPGVGGWGLGPALAGEGETLRFQHGGSNAGFRATLIGYADRGQGVVVMTNSDSGYRLAQEIVLAVAAAYDLPGIEQDVITPLELPAGALAEYAGDYSPSPASALVVRIRLEDDHLVVHVPGQPPSELVPVEQDIFLAVDSRQRVVFERDAGEVVGITSPIALQRTR
jgi:CubicO group peptidase (beta-lactamase class C family)